MVIWSIQHPEFFRRKPEIADPRVLTGEVKAEACIASDSEV